MKQPLSFAHGNLVFGRDLDDAWALYRLETRSYAGQPRSGKRELLALLASFAYSLERDFQLLRVTRPWSVDGYLSDCERTADSRHTDRDRLREYLEGHRLALAVEAPLRPEVYLSVRLATPAEEERGAARLVDEARRLLGLRDACAISARRIRSLLREEEKVHERVADFLGCERGGSLDLQWLVRRAFCRGLGEPRLDELYRP